MIFYNPKLYLLPLVTEPTRSLNFHCQLRSSLVSGAFRLSLAAQKEASFFPFPGGTRFCTFQFHVWLCGSVLEPVNFKILDVICWNDKTQRFLMWKSSISINFIQLPSAWAFFQTPIPTSRYKGHLMSQTPYPSIHGLDTVLVDRLIPRNGHIQRGVTFSIFFGIQVKFRVRKSLDTIHKLNNITKQVMVYH